jgi:hypothetical protein
VIPRKQKQKKEEVVRPNDIFGMGEPTGKGETTVH